ncbi:putative N-acetyltransferase YsnE [compost metagenome]
MNSNINFVQVLPDDPDLISLISKLDQYLYELYPADEVFGVDLNDPYAYDIHFVIAYLDETPVGCGAVRELDEQSAELKRFFVEPEYRNRGIAGLILNQLENEARHRQYKFIKLETGDPQNEAIRFYKKNGYYHIASFGEYTSCPSSVCFEKKL